MAKNDNGTLYPILARGEKYVQEEGKPGSGGGRKDYPRSFDQACSHLLPQLQVVQQEIGRLPQNYRLSEVVIAFDLLPDFLAKSYFPNDLLGDSNLNFIGSRSITVPLTELRKAKRGNEQLQTEKSRKLFVSGPDVSIDNLMRRLNASTRSKNIEQQFQRLESVSLQSVKQKMIGITEHFEGLAEVVLHAMPASLRKEEVEHFLALCKKLRLKCNPARIRSYREGPIFCPVCGDSEKLQELARYNPLRAIRPIPSIPGLAEIRSASVPLPSIPPGISAPPLVVGMFDGGVDARHPALKLLVREESLTPESPVPEGLAHGTAVAGALAYGPVEGSQTTFPPPRVGIHSFRVFPVPKMQDDSDLNYIIDQIESIVPQRDLQIYNLSFGPKKPIEDDEIDRFTYALDHLAQRQDVVFFIAVGNDGDLTEPYNRVQPASDMVNGVGVAALTRKSGKDNQWEMVHAPYSSVGPGRQGARRKPDISAFGGSMDQPFLILSSADHGSLGATQGTSFASPVVAGLAGELRNTQKGLLNPLAVRTLLLHTARKLKEPVERVGVGEVARSVDDAMHCSQNRVTIVYQDEIEYGGYCRLPILLPTALTLSGNVEINWTLVYLPKVNPNCPDEYTLEQVDVAFRPNDQVFTFSPPMGGSNKLVTVNIATEPSKSQGLIQQGYSQSLLPKAKTAKKPYMTEQDLRGVGKWNDTVVVGNGNTRSDGLHNPSLTLHIEERYGATGINPQEAVPYACAITIETKKGVNLYKAIRQQFQALTPLRVKERVRV